MKAAGDATGQLAERDPWVRMMRANADIQYYVGIHRRGTTWFRRTNRAKKGM